MREMSKNRKNSCNRKRVRNGSIRLDNAGGTLFVDALNVATLSANFDTDTQGGSEILSDFNGAVGTTSSVAGGELGGILNFRSQILSPAIENLDALAVSTATEINLSKLTRSMQLARKGLICLILMLTLKTSGWL